MTQSGQPDLSAPVTPAAKFRNCSGFPICSYARGGTGLFPGLVAGFEIHSGWFCRGHRNQVACWALAPIAAFGVRFGEGIMQFADGCRKRALALLARDSKSPTDPMAHMWLTLALVEDQLAHWTAQLEKELASRAP
jgi:hypothetical protein